MQQLSEKETPATTPVNETPAEATAAQEEVVEKPAEVVVEKWEESFSNHDFQFIEIIMNKQTVKSYEEARQNLNSLIKTHFDDNENGKPEFVTEEGQLLL